ncbi:MAG: DUF2252 family protein [Labilithrix sp.]|nr:DUF2252 family protein [Labilithrix sp.]
MALPLAALLAGCAPKAVAPPPAPAPRSGPPLAQYEPACANEFGSNATFTVDRAALRAKGASQAMIDSLDASAFHYFRALGPAFASRTCAAFRDVKWHLPMVAIHGDAHLEQLVVTPATYGLEDFDQAGFGPAVVDLVRYAASIHVACREVKWKCDADEAVNVYFKTYRDALDRASERKVPAVVGKIRRANPDMVEWLRWVDGLMQPLTPADDALKRRGWADVVTVLGKLRPDRPASFYEIVRIGALHMGIGSALESKVLIRIQGPSPLPNDDLVIEARATTPPTGDECAWRPSHGGSLHVLMFMSILGRRMPDIYGFATFGDSGAPEHWLQSWDPGYRELSLGDLERQSDLNEVAHDAGHQLAGHFWARFPEALRAHQRVAQLRAFDLVEARARDMAKSFADETLVAWERFRRAK